VSFPSGWLRSAVRALGGDTASNLADQKRQLWSAVACYRFPPASLLAVQGCALPWELAAPASSRTKASLDVCRFYLKLILNIYAVNLHRHNALIKDVAARRWSQPAEHQA